MLRLALFLPYFAVVFFTLSLFNHDNSFCFAPGRHNYLLMVAELSLALSLWDLLASSLLSATFSPFDPRFDFQWTRVLAATLLVAAGLIYLPFWIYPGAGVFRLARTWFDVGCFFTEGNSTFFLYIFAPALSLLTLLREALFVHLASRAVAPSPRAELTSAKLS